MRDLLFAVGTIAFWLSLAIFTWIAFQLGNSVSRRKAGPPNAPLIPGLSAIACLIVSLLTTSATEPGMRIPIFWVILPFSGWATLVCTALALYNGFALPSAIRAERNKHGQAAMMYGLGALGFLLLFTRDSDATQILVRGWIPVSPLVAAGLLLVLLGAAFSLGFSRSNLAANGRTRGVILHAVLAGFSFVFCVPFFYLLSTSFKEDRDMSSPEGMIWIPRVQRTVPYFNPKEPLYETRLDGQRVEGVIVGQDGNRVRLDISRPFAMRGKVFDTERGKLKEIPREAPLVSATVEGARVEGQVLEDLEDGRRRVLLTSPKALANRQMTFRPDEVEPIRDVGLRWQNYSEAIEFMPPETKGGWLYLRNTLVIVLLSIVGTILSSSIVAYAFSRMRFPWRDQLFAVLLATMMLPGAVTMLPRFLIFRYLGWVDTLFPLWAPAFFASAFNVFMLRQFFKGIPMELEDAAKVDGCSYLRTFWSIMMPQIMPALSVIFIWTFTAAWNDFQGPLIYINSPENMPLSYALQLFSGDRSNEPGLMMAFATMTVAPIIVLFFAMQRYFIEGVTLSGFGGR